tara:strand:- start:19 stop:234 length:216 start_codon:yes stop_codon:yes gene_type:complete
MTTHRDKIRGKLENGGYEDYKSISISAIERPMLSKVSYQVHCDHYKNKFSKLYNDVEEAMDKFFDLRKRIR